MEGQREGQREGHGEGQMEKKGIDCGERGERGREGKEGERDQEREIVGESQIEGRQREWG